MFQDGRELERFEGGLKNGTNNIVKLVDKAGKRGDGWEIEW